MSIQIIWPQSEQAVAVNDGGDPVPGARLALPASPNSFNLRTTIGFVLDRAAWTRVGVFELTGRRVTVLADGAFDAGPQALRRQGADAGPVIVKHATMSLQARQRDVDLVVWLESAVRYFIETSETPAPPV